MTYKKTPIVNMLQGSGIVKTEPLEGLAKNWFFFKGLSGNTHPGAQLPFGKLSVCGYSGGYPTGYGNKMINCGEPIKPLYDANKLIGFTHLHHSGTSAIGYYYNYALTTAFYGDLREPELHDPIDEAARPGYYAVTDAQTGIRYEGTVSRDAVHHRYTFGSTGGRILVDFTNVASTAPSVNRRLSVRAVCASSTGILRRLRSQCAALRSISAFIPMHRFWDSG